MRSYTRIASTLLLTAGLWLALVAAMPPLGEAERTAIAGIPAPDAACDIHSNPAACWLFGR